MSGISLVTKGFIHPTQVGGGNGSGGAGWARREDEVPKPLIRVLDVNIEGISKEPLTEHNIKVKTVKIIVDQKD